MVNELYRERMRIFGKTCRTISPQMRRNDTGEFRTANPVAIKTAYGE